MAKEFNPAMVKSNHGMIVTVASLMAYMTVPNMTDYAAYKVAALSFHKGLTAKLKTRYNMPKLRMIIISLGHTKIPLFQGYKNDSEVLVVSLKLKIWSEAIVQKELSGYSGQAILPGFGATLTFLRALQH
ncbi:hypothetical protein B2J93_5195 [Marssonina coronariae]|uniref:Uncharacterized protein n=1 Tax=Diplocarpon coronariae TaxID=2795749 RepID=A0A218ZHS2_9HELO|nr:hypothetical protein B2J93_5195 [Marssonina coronariae]